MQDKPPKAAGDLSPASAIAAQPDEVVLPVVVEELSVETTRVARGAVRLQSRVETREETVDLPRDENGVFVIPVVEEVTMIEKRLILRESSSARPRSVTATVVSISSATAT